MFSHLSVQVQTDKSASVQTEKEKEAKDNRIPVDRATAIRFSDLIRTALEFDPNAVEMPINLREDIAGMMHAYLDHHRSSLIPKRIPRPLREKEFSKNIKNPWDYRFIEWVYHLPSMEAHRRQIMEKMRFNSFADLVKYAIREGLTTLEAYQAPLFLRPRHPPNP